MSTERPRRERRYTLVNPELIQAEILPRDADKQRAIVAEVREIAPSSVKLLVTGPPELRFQCRVVLKSHRFKGPLALHAEVHWARPNPAGDWLLGCTFDEPMSEAAFQELIDSGVLNRRNSVRERSRIPVQVQLQPGEPRVSAVVSDFSEGGLCLTISEAPQVTRHLCVYGVVAGEEERIPLKIRWALSVGPKRLVGCQFIRDTDYESLRKMHLELQRQSLDVCLNPGPRPKAARIERVETVIDAATAEAFLRR